MKGLVVSVKVTNGEESVEHMGNYPIDAIEFLCAVQRAIELGRPVMTAGNPGRAIVKVTYGSAGSEV